MASDERLRITINFRDKERDLYDYIVSKGDIIGVSAAIKLLIKEAMEKEGK